MSAINLSPSPTSGMAGTAYQKAAPSLPHALAIYIRPHACAHLQLPLAIVGDQVIAEVAAAMTSLVGRLKLLF